MRSTEQNGTNTRHGTRLHRVSRCGTRALSFSPTPGSHLWSKRPGCREAPRALELHRSRADRVGTVERVAGIREKLKWGSLIDELIQHHPMPPAATSWSSLGHSMKGLRVFPPSLLESTLSGCLYPTFWGSLHLRQRSLTLGALIPSTHDPLPTEVFVTSCSEPLSGQNPPYVVKEVWGKQGNLEPLKSDQNQGYPEALILQPSPGIIFISK